MRECSIDGCHSRVVARGWCSRHYQRWKNHGDPTKTLHTREANGTPADVRLWRKIERGGPDDCWPWLASVNPAGYGRLNVGGKFIKAHRLAWESTNGPIPSGLHVLHRCDNPRCCNPRHLFLGTHADNMADLFAKRRRAYGERHWMARLTERDVIEMRAMRSAGESYQEIARRFGVARMTAKNAILGKTWAHVPQPSSSHRQKSLVTRPRLGSTKRSR